MKTLWFVPTPPKAVLRHFRSEAAVSGGWIQCLEDAVAASADFELTVACEWPKDFRLEKDGVTYFGISRGSSRSAAQRFMSNWGLAEDPWRDGLRRCIAVAKEVRPDVVHVHGTERYYGLVAGAISSPVVVSLQGLLNVCSRMYRRGQTAKKSYWFDPVRFTKGHGLVHGELRIRRGALREQLIMSRADLLLGRTRWDRDVASILSPSTPYRECGELLRPEFHGARWQSSQATTTVYTTMGRAPYKGLETIVEAIALLRSSGRDVSLRVGGDVRDSQMGLASTRLAKRLGVESAIAYCGYLSPAALVSELIDCSAYACASHAENSPNSLAEAMMVGVPCVAASVGGVPSMVNDGVSGLLVPDGDPWAMAGAIAGLLEDVERARQLGRKAQDVARKRHSPTEVLRQLAAAYAVAARCTSADQLPGLGG